MFFRRTKENSRALCELRIHSCIEIAFGKCIKQTKVLETGLKNVSQFFDDKNHKE